MHRSHEKLKLENETDLTSMKRFFCYQTLEGRGDENGSLSVFGM